MNAIIQQHIILAPADEFKQRAAYLFRDRKRTTRENYIKRLPDFHTFIQKNGFDKRVLRGYNTYLLQRSDISAATKDAYLRAARALVKELRFEYDLPEIDQQATWAESGKKHKKLGPKDEEVEKLTNHLRVLPLTPTNARLKAIMSLLLFQGLRQVEITRLTVEDINFSDMSFMVQKKGKHNKERRDLHPTTAKNIQEYLGQTNLKSGQLIPLTTKSIRRLVVQTFKSLGIDKSTHGTRHWFTTKLIRLFNGNLFEVMKFTGHESIETLRVYYDEIGTEELLPKYHQAFEPYGF